MRPKKIVFFLLRFQQNEKRNELINLINLPWKRGFIKISIYGRFYSFVTFFFSFDKWKKEKRMNLKEETRMWQWDFNIRVSHGFWAKSTYFSTFHVSYDLDSWKIFFSHSHCNFLLHSITIFPQIFSPFGGSGAKEKFVAKIWNEMKLNWISCFLLIFNFQFLFAFENNIFLFFLLFWLNTSFDHKKKERNCKQVSKIEAN